MSEALFRFARFVIRALCPPFHPSAHSCEFSARASSGHMGALRLSGRRTAVWCERGCFLFFVFKKYTVKSNQTNSSLTVLTLLHNNNKERQRTSTLRCSPETSQCHLRSRCGLSAGFADCFFSLVFLFVLPVIKRFSLNVNG
ncbi:hypothetical protein CAOG_08468 [Capsaspora owczarzaki ATCC 30864]|uniref:hypothetical protein n=1 Tax=Capsaspora owczarzaki (strain ATCC 30864) TaxID=595528 RepID=UPI0003520DE8|nr:hypothetical protein CAOG_08468 [Capsaspora owczarzaki ATCC 30864]|eukprot:XP_011270040.1 hypothetical protein CAOG_08468 [Capsaspora owczarzaki ATCC 30864]